MVHYHNKFERLCSFADCGPSLSNKDRLSSDEQKHVQKSSGDESEMAVKPVNSFTFCIIKKYDWSRQ